MAEFSVKFHPFSCSLSYSWKKFPSPDTQYSLEIQSFSEALVFSISHHDGVGIMFAIIQYDRGIPDFVGMRSWMPGDSDALHENVAILPFDKDCKGIFIHIKLSNSTMLNYQ